MPASEGVRSADLTEANERLYPLDVLKAVSIITVVAIHAFLPWGERNRPPFLLWLGLATIFAVPGLFFAAGFLAGRSRTDSVKLYWAQRLRRILAPYLLASALTLFLPHPLTGASWSSARDVLFALAFGSAWGPYYFVVVLVQLVLVTPLLWRLPTTLLAGLTIVFTATSFWYRVNPFFFTGSLFWALRHPFYWWGYYLLGMWMARTEFGRQFVSRGTANAWLLIALPIASVLLTAKRTLSAAEARRRNGNPRICSPRGLCTRRRRCCLAALGSSGLAQRRLVSHLPVPLVFRPQHRNPGEPVGNHHEPRADVFPRTAGDRGVRRSGPATPGPESQDFLRLMSLAPIGTATSTETAAAHSASMRR